MADNISNVPQNIDMTTFRSIISSEHGPSKSSRFMVMIDLPQVLLKNSQYSATNRELPYLCEAAEFPGRGLMSNDVRYYGPNFKSPFQTTYEDLNLTFICRDTYKERELFDTWMEKINPVNTYDFEYRKNYITRIKIYQIAENLERTEKFNENDGTTTVSTGVKANYSFTVDEAFPILINPQPVTWADDNFNRLTIGFTYKRWYREGFDNINNPTYNIIADSNVTRWDNAGNPISSTYSGPTSSIPYLQNGSSNPDPNRYGRYGNNVNNPYDEQRRQAEGRG